MLRLTLSGLLAAAWLAGCATEPAFRAERPERIDLDGKTLAIIGDLQLTAGFVRMVRRREDNAAAQGLLFEDLESRIDELGALVIVGDLVFSARSAKDWAHMDTLVAPFAARMPVLPAIGNHDYPCWFVELCRTSVIAPGMHDRFPWIEPGKAYAVDAGDLLLLFIDSESGLEAQGQWLEAELAAAVGRYRAGLVFFHRPAYSNSIDRGAVGSTEVEARILPPMRAAGLPVVGFSGHIHGYEYFVRDGLHLVTTGGGGGPRGPMAEQRPYDEYAGPDCPGSDEGAWLRPLNYLLLRYSATEIRIEVRGLCGAGESVRVLDSITLAD